MLPKNYRLKKRSAFAATYKTGKVYRDGGINLFCGKIKHDNRDTKFGFVVSKKIHKRAVKRNRIRRLMRESIRLYIKSKEKFDSKYMSLIFVASSSLLDKKYNEIDNIIKRIMSNIEND